VVASGYKIDVIKDLMEGKLVGTIFVHHPFDVLRFMTSRMLPL